MNNEVTKSIMEDIKKLSPEEVVGIRDQVIEHLQLISPRCRIRVSIGTHAISSSNWGKNYWFVVKEDGREEYIDRVYRGTVVGFRAEKFRDNMKFIEFDIPEGVKIKEIYRNTYSGSSKQRYVRYYVTKKGADGEHGEMVKVSR